MLMEVGLIVVGIPVGWLLRKNQSAQKAAGETLTWTIRILLFLLGLSLGSNDALMSQLNTLGVRAAVISVFSIGGSILLGRFLNSRLNLDEPPTSEVETPKPESSS